MATILPETPMVNLGSLYINGLIISVDATTPLSVIDVEVGQCRDSTNINDIVINPVYNLKTVPPTLTANYVTASLLFNGVGGLDSGTVAAYTMYAVYAIGSSTNQAYLVNYSPINQVPPVELPYSAYPGAALLSANFVQPTLPQGYDMFRRIGTVTTDINGHIIEFRQIANNDNSRTMFYSEVIQSVANGVAAGYTTVPLNAVGGVQSVPASGGVVPYEVTLFVAFTPSATGSAHVVNFKPTGSSAGSSYAQFGGPVAAVANYGYVTIPVPVTGNIDYKVGAGDSVGFGVTSFVDFL